MNKKEILNKLKKETSFISKKYYFSNRVFSFSIIFSLALSNVGITFSNDKDGESFTSSKAVYGYIDKNPYLDKNEKESLHYVENFVNDYYYLLDVETLKERLQIVDIDYKDLESNVYASWKSNIDVINLYYCKNSGGISDNKSIISHELYHMFSVNHDKEYSECLSEGMASLLNYEYSDFENSDLYVKERQIARLFSILVGKENMMDSYLNFDMNKLKKSLKKISTNKQKLEGLFQKIEEYHKLNKESFKYINKTLDIDTYKKYEELNDKKYELAVGIAADFNYYAMSKEIEMDDKFYTAINTFSNTNDEVMEIDNKYYVYLVHEDSKMYTLNKKSQSKKVLVK